MNRSLKIADMFYSVQGEGFYTGCAAFFIRFHGCNLNCDFCDEPLHKSGEYIQMSAKDIADVIEGIGAKFVVLTGGEPSLYNLNPLIRLLNSMFVYVAVETNGYNYSNICRANYVTYSPKGDIDFSLPADEYKFIINQHTDMTQILQLSNVKKIYLQPEADRDLIVMENVKRAIDFVKKHQHLRLSCQVHKMLNIK